MQSQTLFRVWSQDNSVCVQILCRVWFKYKLKHMMPSQTLFGVWAQDKLKYTDDNWINAKASKWVRAPSTTRLFDKFQAANHLDKLCNKLYVLSQLTSIFVSYYSNRRHAIKNCIWTFWCDHKSMQFDCLCIGTTLNLGS